MQNAATDHILIIGAGASGLIAGISLARSGRQVTILEARDRCGGRIHSVSLPHFTRTTELGAEFVHGLLPHTLRLLTEAGIDPFPASGKPYKRTIRGLELQGDMIEGWEELVRKASLLERDTSLDNFLDQYFSGAGYEELRRSVRRFTEGYDAADSAKASVFSLRKEWEGEMEDQFRVPGGYGRMVSYLEQQFREAGGQLHLQSPVTHLSWQSGQVAATVKNGNRYEAARLVCTVPIGVLQAPPGIEGAIRFEPELPPDIAEAIGNIGYGPVIKFLFQFKERFWERPDIGERLGLIPTDMGFVFTYETVPTWWTQHPDTDPLLTGWLSGPDALPWYDSTDEALLEEAMKSLSRIFLLSAEELEGLVQAKTVYNWLSDPYARGSYSYAYPDSERARKRLNRPLDNTIYFAGEGYYRGNAAGTVEAALISGLKVADIILTGRL